MKALNLDEIITKRTLLKTVRPVEYLQIFDRLPAKEVCSLFGLKTTKEYQEAKQKLAKGLITYNLSFTYFYIVDKATAKTIGWIGYHKHFLDHSKAEIGYYLMEEEYKNKGIMSEVMPFILEYGLKRSSCTE